MEHQVHHCGILILAAGQSSRLGSPKQLLAFQDTTLIGHAASVALSTELQPVLVVVGANAPAVREALRNQPVQVVQNPGWEEGMASSIRVGVKALQEGYPELDGVICMVCDQPFVTKSLLLCLLKEQAATGRAAVASRYGGKLGTPALFHRSFWPALMQLTGDTGARKLLAAQPDQVAVVDFEEGAADIDTREDYERLTH